MINISFSRDFIHYYSFMLIIELSESMHIDIYRTTLSPFVIVLRSRFHCARENVPKTGCFGIINV